MSSKNKPQNWDDFEKLDVDSKKQYLLAGFPKELRRTVWQLIATSSLDYNDLMAPTLIFYGKVSQTIYTNKARLIKLDREINQMQKQNVEILESLKKTNDQLQKQNTALLKLLKETNEQGLIEKVKCWFDKFSNR